MAWGLSMTTARGYLPSAVAANNPLSFLAEHSSAKENQLAHKSTIHRFSA
jgi:hypothetical protein